MNEKFIQILAWNVDKLRRHTRNPEFKEFCSGYDIICVIETWGRSQDDFSDLLETHEAFTSIRSEAENYSGGIIVYINKHILPGCARIFTTFKDSVFIKLDKTLFSLERDLIVGAIYLSPAGSVIYTEGESGVQLLEEKIAKIMNQHHDCDILLAGDFNSRTDHLEDYILSDNTDYIPEIDGNDNYDTDHFEVPRNSKDPEQNSFGRELITFCRSYGIHILNGRKEGDIDGKITCISNGGSSVVDYMMVNTRIYDMVKRFEVLTRTESDHFPLICELDCKFMSHSSGESVLSEINFTSYKWCTSKENDFQEKLNDEYTSEKLDNIRGLLNQTPDINNVDKIVTLLQDSFRYWCGCMTVKPRQNHLNRQPP